jgi:hypothetical protein
MRRIVVFSGQSPRHDKSSTVNGDPGHFLSMATMGGSMNVRYRQSLGAIFALVLSTAMTACPASDSPTGGDETGGSGGTSAQGGATGGSSSSGGSMSAGSGGSSPSGTGGSDTGGSTGGSGGAGTGGDTGNGTGGTGGATAGTGGDSDGGSGADVGTDSGAGTADGGDSTGGPNIIMMCKVVRPYHLDPKTPASVKDFCDYYEKFCKYDGPAMMDYKDRADCETSYGGASPTAKACRAGQLCVNKNANGCHHAAGYHDDCGK